MIAQVVHLSYLIELRDSVRSPRRRRSRGTAQLSAERFGVECWHVDPWDMLERERLDVAQYAAPTWPAGYEEPRGGARVSETSHRVENQLRKKALFECAVASYSP